ncbi:hypothetical protein FOZ60_015485 [Perkinsus olseni]|uniref:Uncharacterized protein n=1 Tax=Perkinsus olseni TaxID=32597 RepID=A0A7J6N5A9_PEROL|nr:hypothetical protein FOZ60_015485 [Perkinsus olseni]
MTMTMINEWTTDPHTDESMDIDTEIHDEERQRDEDPDEHTGQPYSVSRQWTTNEKSRTDRWTGTGEDDTQDPYDWKNGRKTDRMDPQMDCPEWRTNAITEERRKNSQDDPHRGRARIDGPGKPDGRALDRRPGGGPEEDRPQPTRKKSGAPRK